MDKLTWKDWVTALRSGKYKQGRGKLRIADKYCCLGVGCDISGLGVWEHPLNDLNYSFSLPETIEKFPSPYTAVMPREVWKFFNIPYNYDFEISLTKMNDKGKNFSEIADCIEQYCLERKYL